MACWHVVDRRRLVSGGGLGPHETVCPPSGDPGPCQKPLATVRGGVGLPIVTES
jgi:hypothetical protein